MGRNISKYGTKNRKIWMKYFEFWDKILQNRDQTIWVGWPVYNNFGQNYCSHQKQKNIHIEEHGQKK